MNASILINNYNYGRFLDPCLRSAFAQTRKVVEVILYDDGSTDESASVWTRYPSLRVIAKPNHGRYPSFNQANAVTQAFRESTGDVVFLLDSDDVCDPERVERVLERFAARPDLVMVQHRLHEIDETGARTGGIRANVMAGIDVRRAIYATGALEYWFMQTSGLAFRRSFLEKILPVDDTKYPLVWIDVRLTRAAIFEGPIETIFEPLGEYRIHDAGDSKKRRDRAFYRTGETTVVDSPEAFERELRAQQYAYFNELARAHGAPPLPLERRSKARFYAYALTCVQDPRLKVGFLYRALRSSLGFR